MAFVARALPTGVGEEILGLDLEGDISPETAEALRERWIEAGILLFRGIGKSPEALLKISRCFGELEPHPIETFRLPGYPELILLTNQNGLKGPVYAFDGVPTYGRIPWHVDLAFKTTPNAGALLRMVQKTKQGGQTGWLDTAMAYDALDTATQARLDGLEARYEFRTDIGDMTFSNPGGVRVGEYSPNLPHFPPVAHPLVWVHPVSGRKVLNVTPLNIVSIIGMEKSESDALIQKLIDHVTQPRFIYMHEWENDDIMLWDNRRMMHCAMGHPVDEIRIVQRSTIRGDIEMGRVLDDAAVAA